MLSSIGITIYRIQNRQQFFLKYMRYNEKVFFEFIQLKLIYTTL